MTRATYVDVVLDELAKAGERYDVIVRLLLSIDRRMTAEEAEQVVSLAIEHRERGVVGIDLSGNPFVGEFATFAPALERARSVGLAVVLHFAECRNDKEAEEMVRFAPTRLGHGVFVPEHVEQLMFASPIPLEICISSNLASRIVPSSDEHHFGNLFQRSYPLCICVSIPTRTAINSPLTHTHTYVDGRQRRLQHYPLSRVSYGRPLLHSHSRPTLVPHHCLH